MSACSGVDASVVMGDGAADSGADDSSMTMDVVNGPDGGTADAADARPDASNGCPQGMVRVDGPTPFCIDATETTAGQYAQFFNAVGNNFVRPQDCMFKTQLHAPTGSTLTLPAFNVDWCDAFAYCAWANKRLCGRIGGGGLNNSNYMNANEGMWSRACTHGGTQPYPYGTMQNLNACRGGQATPVSVGTMPACEGGYPGIFDMNGNAQEWEDACEGTGATATCSARGGDYMDAQNTLSCANVFLTQRQSTSSRVGLRCCRD
jgi:formylglycine-generating enzyme required for sulfatase activity